jgi:hypothetical protein
MPTNPMGTGAVDAGRSPQRSEDRVDGDVQQAVALSADAADLHAPVPMLLLELQSLLGALTATVTAITDRGRRPFRPPPDWPARLGELAYGVYLVGDHTGVDVAQAVTQTAANLRAHAQRISDADDRAWPFDA